MRGASGSATRGGGVGRGPAPRVLVAVLKALAVPLVLWVLFVLSVPGVPSAAVAAPPQSTSPDPLADELERRLVEDAAPLFATYCAQCHGGEKPKAGIRLEGLRTLTAARAMTDDLARVREMVRTREMPPKEKPQPSDHERLVLTQWLEAMLDFVPVDAPPDPGWFTIHKLNRSEYRNTMRDLLGIDPKKIDIAARLPRDDTGYGFDNIADVLSTSPLAIEQYLDSAERAIELSLGPRVTFGDEPKAIRLGQAPNGQPLPGGGQMLYSNGGVGSDVEAPITGEYMVRIEAWETHAGDEHSRLSLRIDGKEAQAFSISGTKETPQEVSLRTRLPGGRHKVAANFTNDFYRPNVEDRNLAVERITLAGPLDEATSQRPKMWTRMLGASKNITDDDERARAVLRRFADRAYRRPASKQELDALLAVYQARRDAGEDFEGATRTALTAALVSPHFLYRDVDNPDSDDPSVVYTLSAYELASRLSYFLWSSMPDEALLAAASDGSLLKDDVLSEQVRRMLADPRSDAFIENFSGQWLQLRSLEALAIDTAKFPEYDAALRDAMLTEARLFFADVLRNDSSVLEFINSDHTFANERLARYYGIDGDSSVTGDAFQRIVLAEGSPRGGILTMGAVLTLTSHTTRTSPVKRGLYVLDQILGAPPPPPPADVPPLEKAHVDDPAATLREQLAAHVANPTCAVCHNRLDPLGLAFENFDAAGRWRDREGERPIDATGTLPGGITFRGPWQLKKILLDRADQFVETLSGKVLTYAMGRGLEPFDRPAVRAIARATREKDNRFGAMIEAVVLSDSFRTCRGREIPDE